MRRRNFPTLAAAAMAMSAGAVVGMSGRAQAGTVVVTGNSISGVDGVVYAGSVYDVTFFAGTFNQVYGIGSRPLPFPINQAQTAANSLLSTVDLGVFALQNGVSLLSNGSNVFSYTAVQIVTPYLYDSSLGLVYYSGEYVTVSPSLATGAPALSIAGTSTQQLLNGFISGAALTTLNGSPVEYAVWTAQVPEPDSAALLGTGLVAAAVVGRRKRRRA